jgi:putative oxidoreductase
MFDALIKNTVAPLVLRLALAAIFIFHGFHKVHDEGNEWGAAWLKMSLPNSSEPPGKPMQLAVAWGELVGGAALAIGFLTRLAAVGIIALMAGTIATVHWPNFNVHDNGFEYNMLIIAACAVLVLTGPGHIAVDRFLRLRRRQ